jgi:glycerol-3-phosphate acyltransferase PlsX
LTISIAIDAMGGDRAPAEIVRGAVQAARESDDLSLFLVGREDEVRTELEAEGWNGQSIEIVPAEHVIEMSDSPVESLSKKRGSSIEIAMRMVREGKAGAFVSAGNTGACVAAGSLYLGRLPAVRRPGIAVVFNTGRCAVVVIDVGANVQCKPEHLIQYGVMATIYSEEILGQKDPRVGLLNIGEEDQKGHALAKTTHGLFRETRLNFVGNCEGSEIFKGDLGVVVCDGFVGNIVLKVAEGLGEHLVKLLVHSIQQGVVHLPDSETAAPFIDDIVGNLTRTVDYSEYGGAPLLGVDGNVIIAHGRSDSKAIANAVKVAGRMAKLDLNSRITSELQALSKK